MSRERRRWSFRTRITALIAGVFVTGGAVLLGVQFFLVQDLFNTAVTGFVGCFGSSSVPGGSTFVMQTDLLDDPNCTQISPSATEGIDSPLNGAVVSIEQTNSLTQEFVSSLLVWSIVILLGFTLVAILVASWLSRRTFSRIRTITDTTKRITRDDLHQRLDLPGPLDEIKELGDTIDSMLDGLEESFTRQERFITNASHELRTPLTTTRTALEIPLSQGRVPDDLKVAVSRAIDANKRSEQLIAALLELARSSAHGARGEVAEFSFDEIVARSVDAQAQLAASRGVEVTTALHAASVTASDTTLLELAVNNLVDNAVRHVDAGGNVRVVCGENAAGAWLEVTNTGAEFTNAEAARLVEPFDRGHGTRTAANGRSLGLGLTLVENIVESMGAELTVAPRAGGGLVVRVQFA